MTLSKSGLDFTLTENDRIILVVQGDDGLWRMSEQPLLSLSAAGRNACRGREAGASGLAEGRPDRGAGEQFHPPASGQHVVLPDAMRRVGRRGRAAGEVGIHLVRRRPGDHQRRGSTTPAGRNSARPSCRSPDRRPGPAGTTGARMPSAWPGPSPAGTACDACAIRIRRGL